MLSALAAFAAAGLWFWSTRVQVEFVEAEPVGGIHPALTSVVIDEGKGVGKRIDPWKTGIAQVLWNRWVALAASLAALCQGLATVLTY